ncbi:MAG: glycosyltransferase family 39 protein [Anaerolineae bacterium]|nr:glycosyltransferase family 39 protein [Anaerolineae bacterium]
MERTSTTINPPVHHSLDRRAPVAAMLITAAGGFLRVWEIGHKTLWLDEAFSIWQAWHPLREMVAWVVQIDQHPPLYYALLHLWIGLVGDSPAAVRLLSALLSTLTIPILFLLGRRLFGATVGLLAALILALSPFHVRFAQETRMYALLTFNTTAALLALTYLLHPPSSFPKHMGGGIRTGTRVDIPCLPAAWAAYVVFTAATLLTHNTAIFFPLAVNLFVFGLIGSRRSPPYAVRDMAPPPLSRWLLAQLGVLLLWSPWAAAFGVQAAGVDREFWIARPTFDTVVWTVKNFLSAMLPALGGWSDLIWAGYALLILLGIVGLRQQGARLGLLMILFVTPIAGELLVSLRRPIFYDRTLIWATIPLYLLLANGIAQLRRWPFIAAAFGLVAAANGASLREYYVNFQKEEWDKAAAYVAAQVADDDLLLFNATWVQIPFDYYFRAYGRRITERGVPVDLFERGVLEPKMAASDLPRLRELVAGRSRVWLIYSHHWYTDPHGLIPNALAQEFVLRDMRQFVGLEVRLYIHPSTSR